MQSRKLIITTALVGLALSATAAQASFVQVRDAMGGESASGEPGGLYLVGTGNSLRGTADGGTNAFLFTGTFDFEADFGEGFEALFTYCLEPLVDISFGTAPGDDIGEKYEVTQLNELSLSANDIEYLEILWGNAFALSQAGDTEAAAFQSVIWEIVQDGKDGFNLTEGQYDLNTAFSDTLAAKNLADEWFTNIDNGTWTQRTQLAALTSGASQNLLFAHPTPGTAVCTAAGLGMIGIRRRRK